MVICAFLFTSCISQLNMQEVMPSTDVKDSRVYNLRCYNEDNTYLYATGEKLLKNGFLNTSTEEYGYYSVDIEVKEVESFPFIALTWALWLFAYGAPTESKTYAVTTQLNIFDSKGNIVKQYSDSDSVKQIAGVYYGKNPAKKIERKASELYANILKQMKSDSIIINNRLESVGKITKRNELYAKNNINKFFGKNSGSVDILSDNASDLLLDNAIEKVVQSLIDVIPIQKRIAVVGINSNGKEKSDYISEEISYLFVQTGKFSVVDRKSLDAIRSEQDFQMSGEVSDESAINIGQFLGAEVVITGSLSGTGDTKRLRVKAIDVKTGQILAMGSESL